MLDLTSGLPLNVKEASLVIIRSANSALIWSTVTSVLILALKVITTSLPFIALRSVGSAV